jgi:hypothetical protein
MTCTIIASAMLDEGRGNVYLKKETCISKRSADCNPYILGILEIFATLGATYGSWNEVV